MLMISCNPSGRAVVAALTLKYPGTELSIQDIGIAKL